MALLATVDRMEEVFCSSSEIFFLEIFIFSEKGIFIFHALYASLLPTAKKIFLKIIVKYEVFFFF